MPIKAIHVVDTGITYDLSTLKSVEDPRMGEEALKIVNGLTQDDFAIMAEGSDGKYYFQAGLVCVPGFWRMKDKIGMPLDEIHISGGVPQSPHIVKEKLQMSMIRFFKRLPVDKPVIRNNYSIQAVSATKNPEDVDPNELSWSFTQNGPEDTFTDGRGHSSAPIPHLSPKTLRLRTERQTLRRLPRTGAIMFGIRTYQVGVEELVREGTGVAARLASAVRSWPRDVAGYKGRRRWEEELLGYLDGEKGRGGSVEGELPYPF